MNLYHLKFVQIHVDSRTLLFKLKFIIEHNIGIIPINTCRLSAEGANRDRYTLSVKKNQSNLYDRFGLMYPQQDVGKTSCLYPLDSLWNKTTTLFVKPWSHEMFQHNATTVFIFAPRHRILKEYKDVIGYIFDFVWI